MNLFFEESGDFKVGTVLSQAGEAYQVEMASGKRTKVKVKDVLLQYEKPAPAELLEQAKSIAAEIDLDFLWEVAGEDEFGFAELGAEYFGHAPLPPEAAGLILALHSAPVYFYKKGRGRYKAAPEASLKAALAGIEKKKQQALVQAGYVEELKQNRLPASMQPMVLQLLFKPDKNTIEYKALEAACTELHTTPPRLMLAVGGIASPKDLHLSKFLFENFPKGAGFPSVPVPAVTAKLPLAEVAAFSIDDVTTTEIDDAFSVQPLPDGTVKVGIHIAAPGLGIRPEDVIDKMARQRMSTVYMPGDKITMLPEAVIDRYTLAEGHSVPALSLYLELRSDLTLLGTSTRLERVPIVANLRLDALDRIFTEEALQADEIVHSHAREIRLLWEFACVLEAARGRPEQPRQLPMDYSFYVDDDRVRIVERRRGAPIDKLVAELMIFVNTEWGRTLAEHGAPGIYRAQSGGRVKLTTVPAPHDALGVDQYLWASSPLRRYVDFVNQRQLVAVLQGAPLPYVKGSETLLAVMRDFEVANDAYFDFQRSMERYWCLRWLLQENVALSGATVVRENLVKLDPIPLIVKVPSLPDLPPMTRVEVEVGEIDLLDLTICCQYRARLNQAAA
jgi:exoribonuclease-2